MRKILNSIFKIYSSPQPQRIVNNRIYLQKRQKSNIQLTKTLPVNQEILHMSLKQLSSRVGQDKFGTFVSRCSDTFHQQLNFLADMNIQKALQINKQGIPFTVKDHLKVDQMVSTCGYSSSITPEDQNSEIVDLLIKQGCVPFAHTNIPQGLLNLESGNNVWGISYNPYKKNFISGGSSGGEAVAVATKCSAFGIASDSAGSSRIPAAYCGVVGFKPTGSTRLSRKGRLGASRQQGYLFKDLDVSMGFITRSVKDLQWLCDKTLGKSIKYNPYIIGKWDGPKFEEYKNKKLRYGYILQDHEMKAVPAVRNSILESVQALRKNGHQVVQFKFPDLYKFRNFTFQVLNVIGAFKAVNMFLKGQNQTKQTWWIHQRGQFGRLGSKIRKYLSASDLQVDVYNNFQIGNSFTDLATICQKKNYIRSDFLNEWEKSKIDVLITPVTPFTAPLKNSNQYLLNQLTFCGFPNVLEMPSGTIPIRVVKQQETNYEQVGFYESKISNSIKNSQGLPVGIQISAPYMEDELCVAAMWQLEQMFPRIASPRPYA